MEPPYGIKNIQIGDRQFNPIGSFRSDSLGAPIINIHSDQLYFTVYDNSPLIKRVFKKRRLPRKLKKKLMKSYLTSFFLLK